MVKRRGVFFKFRRRLVEGRKSGNERRIGMLPTERLKHFVDEEDSDLWVAVATGWKLRARSEQHDCLDLAGAKIATAAVGLGIEVFPQNLSRQLDAIENGVIVIELKLDEVAGIVRVGGLEEEVAPDLKLLQNPGRTVASFRQWKTGEFAQPLRMVAEEFMKEAISVHVNTITNK